MTDQNPSTDKINIKGLEDWKVGDGLEARKFQQPVTVLKALGAPGPPSQVVPETRGLFQFKMFKVIELDVDVILCNTWNGLEKGEDEIKVALPFLLRKTPFDAATRVEPPRAGISYAYSEFHIRIATNEEDETEDQIMVALYEPDDLIYAMRGIFGNTGVYHDPDTNEKPVFWLDTNVDGRFWALDDDPPEAE